jgi:demethylmenaquinone methyltransferase/2-methoxy-6-polyprenyl-1,4-benzoquinol methylase
MPFRPSFDCLWCGRRWETRAADDLEGWAQLCADCLGSAGDNAFRRARLRVGLSERAVSGRRGGAVGAVPAPSPGAQPWAASGASPERAAAAEGGSSSHLDVGAADGVERDDWYLRRGRFSNGPIDDMAWQMDLDTATLWLDGLPLSGEIVELAAGTGWWSPLLAGKGELWLYDAGEEPLDRARARLVAHGLRAHLHVRDAWIEPDRAVDALFCGFWLSHVPRTRLAEFLTLARRWLKPGGRFAFIDSRREASSDAAGRDCDTATETATQRLDDGRESHIQKTYHEPAELEMALLTAGFVEVSVTVTARFFLLGAAVAGP